MTSFAESLHPREGDGKFATKPQSEAAVDLDDATSTEDAPAERDCFRCGVSTVNPDGHCTDCERYPRLLEDQLARERAQALFGGVDLADEDAPWSWTAMIEHTSDRYLSDLYDRAGGSIGRAGALMAEDQTRYGFDGRRSQMLAMRRGDLMPSDVDSENPDLRLAARVARGDMIVDGRLPSDSYRLDKYLSREVAEHPTMQGRVIAAPPKVQIGGEEVYWRDLESIEQMAYLDGYAAVVENRVKRIGGTQVQVGPGFTFHDRSPGTNGSPSAREFNAEPHAATGVTTRFLQARAAGIGRAAAMCRFHAATEDAGGVSMAGVQVVHNNGPLRLDRIGRVQGASGRRLLNEFYGYPAAGQMASDIQPHRFHIDEVLDYTPSGE